MFGRGLDHYIGANEGVLDLVESAFSQLDELECWEGLDLEFNDGLDEVVDVLDGVLHSIPFHIRILSDISIFSKEVADTLVGFVQCVNLFGDCVAALHCLIAVNTIHQFR